jgi:predicted DNA-binding transcriptional regulator YafY
VRRLERLLAVALFLASRRRVVARDVAQEFGVSLRTVYRDMRSLASAGFPIEGNAGDGYRLASGAHLRPLALTPDEADAFALAAYGLAVTVTAALREPLARATAKLEAAMPPDAAARLRSLSRRIVAPAFVRVLAPGPEILLAVRDGLSATITFAPPGAAATTRTIEPLGLVARGDAWWVIAYCRLREGARAFRLDHVTAWKTGEVFARRPGFSFEEVSARDAHLSERLFGQTGPGSGLESRRRASTERQLRPDE